MWCLVTPSSRVGARKGVLWFRALFKPRTQRPTTSARSAPLSLAAVRCPCSGMSGSGIMSALFMRSWLLHSLLARSTAMPPASFLSRGSSLHFSMNTRPVSSLGYQAPNAPSSPVATAALKPPGTVDEVHALSSEPLAPGAVGSSAAIATSQASSASAGE